MFGFGKKDPFGHLSVDEVDKLVSQNAASVFDNNSAESYRAGHVPSAKWVNPDAMQASDLPQDKGRKLVFYCGGPL